MTDFNYRISLRPVEDYFFGGEMTFGEVNDKERRSYLAYSNPYPQQTSLLGLLRYMMLECNQALPLSEYREKSTALIGESSFNTNQNSADQSFGGIKKLSPLLMSYEEELYRFAHPLSHLSLSFLNEGQSLFDVLPSNAIPVLEGYDPKEEYLPYILGQGKTRIYFDKIFRDSKQIGISKGAKDQGFFKQQFYRLETGFQFVFFANIQNTYNWDNKENETVLKDAVVFLGGEQKQFFVTVEKLPPHHKIEILNQGEGNKITLLSDALVPESIYSNCLFALADTQDFRATSFQENGFRFYKKSIKYNLLKRGSVLYAKDEENRESIEKLLNKNKNFSQIGFNYYFKEPYSNPK